MITKLKRKTIWKEITQKNIVWISTLVTSQRVLVENVPSKVVSLNVRVAVRY